MLRCSAPLKCYHVYMYNVHEHVLWPECMFTQWVYSQACSMTTHSSAPKCYCVMTGSLECMYVYTVGILITCSMTTHWCAGQSFLVNCSVYVMFSMWSTHLMYTSELLASLLCCTDTKYNSCSTTCILEKQIMVIFPRQSGISSKVNAVPSGNCKLFVGCYP